ncbi:MAG: type II toxin-antitoxin system RelE/ParE family toxin [Cellulomonadaceae bacterium]|jgi:hypothetical protein|nr:type II toxin-antitoxin system RelE/ParE family toxin [Cellulomonadaceae bacterium]
MLTPPPPPTPDEWTVKMSDEVEKWYLGLTPSGHSEADEAIAALAALGNEARMPLSRALGDKLFELRFACENVARRITYTFDPGKKIITLTTFRHQKRTEQKEIGRARRLLSGRITPKKNG